MTPASTPGNIRTGVTALAREWDGYAEEWVAERLQPFWRAHSDAVNSALLERWLPVQSVDCILKTDLFDEAVAAGLFPVIASRCTKIYGIDVSHRIVAAACARYPGLAAVEADVRRLPFGDGSVDCVVSISTLDHFETSLDIGKALAELRRVLKPGGTLVLTLDNLANPIVALRNALPFALTHAAGLVPYPVGATHGPRDAKRLVVEAGLNVDDCTTVMHSPRVLAVPFTRMVDKIASEQLRSSVSRMLLAFERLQRLPTSPITGHFVAIRATRPA